jgi:hypothetical protein
MTTETTITIGPVRLSYLNCWEAKAINEGDKPKFSASIIVGKAETAMLAKISAAVEAAKEVGKDTKFGGKIPPVLKLPLRDGAERPEDEAYSNAWFLNASGNTAPGVVDQARNPIIDKSQMYSGVYAYVNISFYPFNTNGNRGIAVGLNHIMKAYDAEPLAGRVSIDSAFADIVPEAPAADELF